MKKNSGSDLCLKLQKSDKNMQSEKTLHNFFVFSIDKAGRKVYTNDKFFFTALKC